MSNYEQSPAINQSALKMLLDKTPAHFYQAHFGESEPTKESDCLILGRATHCLVLEPQSFCDQFAQFEGGKRTKAGKEEYAALVTSGKSVISLKLLEQAENVAAAIRNHPTASKLLDGCETEVEVFGELEGVKTKSRLDAIKKNVIIDLKTCEDASPKGFQRSIEKYHYDLQAAFYTDAANAKSFVFIAVEKTAPYCIGIYFASESLLENGRRKYRKALETYKTCLETGDWYGYETNITEIDVSSWGIYE